MSLTTEKLYQLLPAIYRIRDAERGEPLKALISLFAQQAGVIEADIVRLYENWFIETCDEWVVPYIGDMLGVRGLHPVSTEARASLRAFVANTLRYRRRKGTAAVLEQLALDITGWRARAVEFFELLGTTQNFNHVRLHNVRTPDLRLTDALELLDTAFDKTPHSVDVRYIDHNRGRHNIPNIGMFLWRLQSYFLHAGSAHPITDPPDGRYTFNPLGDDSTLFNRPLAETEITHLAEEVNVPAKLRRGPLYEELETLRRGLSEGKDHEELLKACEYFGHRPVLEIFLPGSATPMPSEEIMIADLSGWDSAGWQPPPSQEIKGPDGSTLKTTKVSIDPVLGRIAFVPGLSPSEIRASYAYGFSGDLGGGPYDRREPVYRELAAAVGWQVGVSHEVGPIPNKIFATLADAIDKWNVQPAGSVGVIALLDNCTYEETFPVIKIRQGSQLLIVAAKWPEVQVHGSLTGEMRRVEGHLEPDELRPHLLGKLKVKGLAPEDNLTPGELFLDGLLIEGSLSILDGNLGGMKINHCTLVPSKGEVTVQSGNELLQITLNRSICGPIVSSAAISKLFVKGSIIDNAGRTARAIEAPETPLGLQESTIFGEVYGLRIDASNCIFNSKIHAERKQEGCIRFSYVPDTSKHPRCFRCQPYIALMTLAESLGKALPSDLILEQRNQVYAQVRPEFSSIHYGDPEYAQLGYSCALEIRTGASDGAEMGAFNYLQQPQREANLRVALDEYLPVGLEAGIIYVT